MLKQALRTLPLLFLLTLTCCAGWTIQPPQALAPVATTDAKALAAIPLACFDFPPIHFHTGLVDAQTGTENVTVADVLAALKDPVNPLGAARRALGDTMSTRAALQDYYGRRNAIGCPDAVKPLYQAQ